MRLFAGYEMNCGIFVSRVEKGSKAAEVGLKRGDQILEVNSSNFEHAMTLAKATTLLLETTHLAITVKSNLLGESKNLKTNKLNHSKPLVSWPCFPSIAKPKQSNLLNGISNAIPSR